MSISEKDFIDVQSNRLVLEHEDTSLYPLVDLHVYIVPPEIWRDRFNNLLNQAVSETISIGIIRVPPDLKLIDIRDELSRQLEDLVPTDFIFLRSVGRSLTRLKSKQEYQLKAKHFLPPVAYAPELYLLEATGDIRASLTSDGSSRSQSYNHLADRDSQRGFNTYRDGPYDDRYTQAKAGGNSEEHGGTRLQRAKNTHRENYKGTPTPRYSPLPRIESRSASRLSSLEQEENKHTASNKHFEEQPQTHEENKHTASNKHFEEQPQTLEDNKQPHEQPANTDTYYKAPPRHDENHDETNDYYNTSPPPSPERPVPIDSHTKGRYDPHSSPNTNHTNEDSGFVGLSPEERERDTFLEDYERRKRELQQRLDREKEKYNQQRNGDDSYANRNRLDDLEERERLDKERRDKDKNDRKRYADENQRYRDEDKRRREEEDRKRDEERRREEERREEEERRRKEERQREEDEDRDAEKSRRRKEQEEEAERRRKLAEKEKRGKKNQTYRGKTGNDVDENKKRNQTRRNSEEDERKKREDEENRRRDDARRQGDGDENYVDKTKRDGLRNGDDNRLRNGTDKDTSRWEAEDDDNDSRRFKDSEDDNDRMSERKSRRTGSDDDGFPSPPSLEMKSSNEERDTDSAYARRRDEKERLLADLDEAREARRTAEQDREELVKRAKQLQHKTTNRRNNARDVWKKQYFEEKKRTAPLEDQTNRLRHELESIHRKLMTTLEGPKDGKQTKYVDGKPSPKNNYIIQCTRLQHEIDDLRRRSENAKMKLTAEMKLRNQADAELRALRAELTQKKINLTLSRNQQLAALNPGAEVQEGPAEIAAN